MTTVVEWLLDNLISEPYSEEDFKHNSDMWDKAKEMEKQQIIDAYVECWKTHVPNGIEFKLPAKE